MLEYRPTLDDLFGPDLWAELHGALVQAMDEQRQTLAKMREGWTFHVEEYMDALVASVDRTELASARFCEYMGRFGRDFFRIVICPSVEEEGKSHFKFHLFPTLGHWLRKYRWELEDAIRKGMDAVRQALEELRRTLDSLELAADRLRIESIRVALAKLRIHSPIAIEAGAPTPRELISKLLAPLVLAAGGSSDLFIPRC